MRSWATRQRTSFRFYGRKFLFGCETGLFSHEYGGFPKAQGRPLAPSSNTGRDEDVETAGNLSDLRDRQPVRVEPAAQENRLRSGLKQVFHCRELYFQ